MSEAEARALRAEEALRTAGAELRDARSAAGAELAAATSRYEAEAAQLRLAAAQAGEATESARRWVRPPVVCICVGRGEEVVSYRRWLWRRERFWFSLCLVHMWSWLARPPHACGLVPNAVQGASPPHSPAHHHLPALRAYEQLKQRYEALEARLATLQQQLNEAADRAAAAPQLHAALSALREEHRALREASHAAEESKDQGGWLS